MKGIFLSWNMRKHPNGGRDGRPSALGLGGGPCEVLELRREAENLGKVDQRLAHILSRVQHVFLLLHPERGNYVSDSVRSGIVCGAGGAWLDGTPARPGDGTTCKESATTDKRLSEGVTPTAISSLWS